MMNTFKTNTISTFRSRHNYYGLSFTRLPDTTEGSSNGFQLKGNDSNNFTLYHTSNLSLLNEDGAELAFSIDGISNFLGLKRSTLIQWINRLQKNLSPADSQSGRRGKGWPRVGINSKDELDYLIRELDFLYKVEEDKRTYSLKVNRQHQSSFRQRLIEAYGGKCMISGCTELSTLDACHIVPAGPKETYLTRNGLLMRTDLHRLFDEGLLSINPHTALVETKSNSLDYQKFNNRRVFFPIDEEDGPDPLSLMNHYELYFCEQAHIK